MTSKQEKIICGYCGKTHVTRNGKMSKIGWKHYKMMPFPEVLEENEF